MADMPMVMEKPKAEVAWVMHKGAVPIDRNEIDMIPLPAHTDTYAVIPHGQVVDLVEKRVAKEFPEYAQSWRFSAAKDGARIFAALTLRKNGGWEHGPALCLRNSYDRSMSFGFACGLSLFICDNLALRGDFISYMRKHTGNAFEEAQSRLIAGIIQLEDRYISTARDLERMKDAPLGIADGWSMIGRAIGSGVLSPVLANRVFRSWKPGESKYGPRSVFRMVQHMTEELKAAPTHTIMGRLASAHDLGLHQLERGEFEVV